MLCVSGVLPSKAYTTGILFELGIVQSPKRHLISDMAKLSEWDWVNTLLHRQGASPRRVILCLVFIGMVFLFLCLKMYLSVVEILGSAHARQVVLGKHSRYGYCSKRVKDADLAVGVEMCKKGKENARRDGSDEKEDLRGRKESVKC